MTTYSSSLLKLLHERGYIHQGAGRPRRRMRWRQAGSCDRAIVGYRRDRAQCLHVGSLVQIMCCGGCS
jgi:hypothetical protein